MVMNKRLKAFLIFKGTTLAQLERDIGVGAGTLSKAVKNDSAIGADKVMKILQFYGDLSAEWLLRGKGEMILQDCPASVSQDRMKIEMLERQVEQLTKEKDNYWTLLQNSMQR
jgi:transcriptional regulator with XRE-family HTH domain